MGLRRTRKACKGTPLTPTLSPRWGERGKEERTFGKRYNCLTAAGGGLAG